MNEEHGGFEPVYRVDECADAPRVGVAAFRGVPYSFRPATNRPEGWAPRGLLCDLTPIDATRGLPMLADGTFRRATAPQSVDDWIVRWTSFGSPGLAAAPNLRERFAEFLEAFADGRVTLAHRDAFLVEHYADIAVEETRRECVRLVYNNAPNQPLAAHQRVKLRALAKCLIAAT